MDDLISRKALLEKLDKKVPRNCSTCLYGGGIGCGNANVGKDYLAYLYGLRECPHYWLDQNRFEPVDGRRW